MRFSIRIASICLLSASWISQILAADEQSSAKDLADQVCDADQLGNTNDYIKCLRREQARYDKDFEVLIAQIPRSAKARDEILANDVAPAERERWRKNFVGLAGAFRAYRDRDCEDSSIVEAGYGMGGLQSRLACVINATGRQIDVLKKRYDVP